MKAVYVNPIKTELTFKEAYDVHKWRLKISVGAELTDEIISLAMAKTSLETGNYKACWNFNFGNVKASDTYIGMYTCIYLNEVINGKLVWFAPEGQLSAAPSKGGKLVGQPCKVPEGHPQTRMRAFANEYDGIDQYITFVESGRYKTAWKYLLKGDAIQYIHHLKLAGYFTADENLYLKGVQALQRQIIAKIRNLPEPEPEDILNTEWERLKLLVPEIQIPLEY